MNRGLKRTLRTGWLAGRAFFRYQGVNQSAALAFSALLSFIPVIFLALSVAGRVFWGDPAQLSDFIENQLNFLVPWIKQTVHTRMTLLLASAPGLGWMSVVFICWASGIFFAMLQSCLLLPWAREHDHKKGRWRLPLPWLLGPVIGFLLVGAMLLMHLGSFVSQDWLPFAIVPEFWTWLILSILVFLNYRLFLPRRASTTVALVLSMVISGLSQGLTTLFVRVFFSLPNYSVVYGSLAGIVLFLLWLDYNMALILWGGHYIRLWKMEVAGAGRIENDGETIEQPGQMEDQDEIPEALKGEGPAEQALQGPDGDDSQGPG